MSKDLDGVTNTPVVTEDDAYLAIYGRPMNDGDEGERQVGSEPIPRFDYYLLHFDEGKGELLGENKAPAVQIVATVKEGPEGTIGRKVFDTMFLAVSPNKYVKIDGVSTQLPKTKDEFDESVAKHFQRLNRIARVGKFAISKPKSFMQADLQTYGMQFGLNGGFDAIVAVSVQKERPDGKGGNWPAKNRIIWASLVSLDDPGLDKSKKPNGRSTHEEARDKLLKFNERQAAKGTGRAGRTAGSIKKRNPEEAFA